MNKDKRNIDLLFEENLKKFRESPPAYSWDRLEKDLNRENSSKRLFYFRLAAASLLILLAFGAGYFYATYNFEPTQKISQELIIPSNKLDKPNIQESSDVNTNDQANKTDIQPNNQSNEHITVITGDSKVQKDLNRTQQADFNDNKNVAENNDRQTKEAINQQEGIHEDTIQGQQTQESNELNNEIPARKDNIANYEPLPLDPKAKVYGMETTKKKDVKWSVGAQVAPVWSYRDISINYQNQTGSNVQDAESQLNDSEDALLSYGGGIDVNYFLSDRWSIQSGMYYSKIGQVNNNALNFKQENNKYQLFAIQTSTGNIDVAFERIPDDIKTINPPKDTLEGIDLNNVKLIQNFNLFEVPFMINYKILNKKLGINIAGGLSPAYILSNSIILQVDDNKFDVGNSSNLNNMIFNTSISLGINYKLSKKLSLNLEPNFKYSLSPINKNSQFDYHPYYFSWFTGVSYKF